MFYNPLDEIFKELFDFFKDTEENEFDGFEAKTLKVDNVEELAKSISENKNKNVKYSIPIDSFSKKKKETVENNQSFNFINHETIMGDKIIAENLSNNNVTFNVGKPNIGNTNSNDELAKKTFNWQKFGIISSTILAIVAIIVTIIYS